MMYGIEKQLVDQMIKLKTDYDLRGIKAEFEAEGSSFRDLLRLRRVTSSADLGLFLKIGGVEAVRDIKDSLEIGVDGLIAPMVESKFGAEKFVSAYKKIYKDHRIHLSINVETKNGVDQFDEIVRYAEGKVDNITIGRTDLCGSYHDPEITPNCDFILDRIEAMAEKTKRHGLTLTVGGSVSIDTLSAFKQRKRLRQLVYKVETRKIMFLTEQILLTDESLKQALLFEKLYILSKKEFSDLFIESEVARLTELQRRI